jgi:hypothetical protein
VGFEVSYLLIELSLIVRLVIDVELDCIHISVSLIDYNTHIRLLLLDFIDLLLLIALSIQHFFYEFVKRLLFSSEFVDNSHLLEDLIDIRSETLLRLCKEPDNSLESVKGDAHFHEVLQIGELEGGRGFNGINQMLN